MGTGARVFKGRCPPDEKRRLRRIEIGNDPREIARRHGGSIYYRRREATAAHDLAQLIFGGELFGAWGAAVKSLRR